MKFKITDNKTKTDGQTVKFRLTNIVIKQKVE